MPDASIHLNLLGRPTLTVNGSTRPLERKTAALFAYLCVGGQTPRARLAGLLWPDVPDRAARSNLRQTIWRIRSQTGANLLLGEATLELGAGVTCDLTGTDQDDPRADDRADDTDDRRADEVLAGQEFSDCPEFEDWLRAARERHRDARRAALWRRVHRARESGEVRRALQLATHLLTLDPLSESAHRLVMTLHLALEDRGAALAAFTAFEDLLRRDLGVSPLPETAALAASIRQPVPGVRPAGPGAPPARSGPSAAWTPPLTGRTREWADLTAALNAGQVALVRGPAGVGKTRLLREVLTTRGPLLTLDARPGDEAVPYLMLGQALRRLLDAQANLPHSAPRVQDDWVRAEIAHLLPDMWPGRPTSNPLSSPLAQRRLLEAVTALVVSVLPDVLQGGRPTSGPAGALLIDDAQWADDLSWDAWMFLAAHPAWQALGISVGMTLRDAELPAARRETLARRVEAREATLLDLGPMGEADVANLTGDFLALRTGPAQPLLIPALWRHTGGHPLFVIETLRALADSGALAGPIPPGQLPVPSQLLPTLRRRLQQVSAPALRLARVAAVADSDFSAHLAAQVLEVHPVDLAEPWAELEAAQIMSGPGFAHDLISQAALLGVPRPVQALLHARIAASLEDPGTGAVPERIARHWEAAGHPASAAPHWVRAGWVALGHGSWQDAAQDFRQALQAAQAAGEGGGDAQYGLGVALRGSDPAAAEQALLAALNATPDAGREVQLRAALAELYRLCGRLEEAVTQVTRATGPALAALPDAEQADVWRTRFVVHLRAGQLTAAEAAIVRAQTLDPDRPELINEHALVLWVGGRFVEAARRYESIHARIRQPGSPDPAWYRWNLAWTYWAMGDLAQAETLLTAPSLESPFETAVRQVHLSTVYSSQGRLREALAELDAAQPALGAYAPHLIDQWHRRSLVSLRAGRCGEAAALMEPVLALAQETGDPVRLSLLLSTLVFAHAGLGHADVAARWGVQAEAVARALTYPLTTVITQQALAQARVLSGEVAEARALINASVDQARACRMNEFLARGLLLRATLPGATLPAADLREAAQVSRTAGLTEIEYHAARTLGVNDRAWRTRAWSLYRTLERGAPPNFLALPLPTFSE
ncbi:ATP-binding protein [Deinococcus sedimenti]|uniref:Transcriptional activator n=1 Tax=Deinococcus sedimenti TaxID=1867090 RepID=A0ABQ2S9X4_9DEIO|nr:AAA family ATPase [Deinococcus sedimenti]GGS03892.1 transcriptional activator [Deinococcus sedimenti]